MAITWDDEGSDGTPVGQHAATAASVAAATKASVGDMASDAKAMLDSARSGGFRVSEDAAEPLRTTLLAMRDRIKTLEHDLISVATLQPPLGDHDYGQRVASHQRQALAEGPGSAAEVLRQLNEAISDSVVALEAAMKKYKEIEEGTIRNLNSGQE
ncbi:hypothetical protein [Saccharomonospora saliphila]|uniref:hypothetical protein n=1 Tax=Saccharomonospora saliphila TaxID=369829 RepID=UPI00036F2107|nr:hypothetical protein [Saccharomonospora saliphila]